MNSITDILDIEDQEIEILSTEINGMQKTITLVAPAEPTFCPVCSFRMYSRGCKTRTINHPILQDGYQLTFKLRQRRWRCTNPECRYETNEHFKFVDRYRRNSNASDLLIVDAFKDLSLSAVEIGRRFNTSDTHVLNIFDRYGCIPSFV